jgi:hypothetical protein
MNARIVELETTIHQKVQKLLPWATPGRLSVAERELVEQHLAGCAQCQQDLEWQRKLLAIEPAPVGTPDVELALSKLLPRLESRPPRPARRTLAGWCAQLFAGAPGWTRWALAAQLLVVVALAGALLRQGQDYHLLGSHGAAAANLVVLFRPDTSERQLRAILQSNAARVVDGPTVTNAWLLSVAPARRDAAVAALRADAAVELAEPLSAERAP